MTDLMRYRAARAATAIVSMAVFGAVFFELPASGVAAIVLLCLLTLSAAWWVGRRTRRSITEAITAAEARPRPLLVAAIDSAATMPRPRAVSRRPSPWLVGTKEPS